MFTIKPFYLKSNYGNREQKWMVRLKKVWTMPKLFLDMKDKSFVSITVYQTRFKKVRKFFRWSNWCERKNVDRPPLLHHVHTKNVHSYLAKSVMLKRCCYILLILQLCFIYKDEAVSNFNIGKSLLV